MCCDKHSRGCQAGRGEKNGRNRYDIQKPAEEDADLRYFEDRQAVVGSLRLDNNPGILLCCLKLGDCAITGNEKTWNGNALKHEKRSRGDKQRQ